MTRALLLSVRPRFARALLDGTKTAEVRRRFPDVPVGTIVVIYASSPDMAVLGTMKVGRLTRSTPDGIWRDYADSIGIERPELDEYLHGASECSVIELEQPAAWRTPVSLSSLRDHMQLVPPQSFRYLTFDQVERLGQLGRV